MPKNLNCLFSTVSTLSRLGDFDKFQSRQARWATVDNEGVISEFLTDGSSRRLYFSFFERGLPLFLRLSV